MWQVPQVQQLKVRLHLYNVDLDQCQFSSAFRKPTRILVSNAQFLALALKCRGDHPHTALKGRLRLRSGEVVFLTKLAQEYPSEFCKAFAQVTKSVVDHTHGKVIVKNKLPGSPAPAGISSNVGQQNLCSMSNASRG